MKAKINLSPFFILGRERSGTTLLRINLNNHPEIHIPPESPFIIYLYKKYFNNKKIDVKEFVTDLQQEPFLQVWKLDYPKLIVQLEKINPPTFSNYCKVILAQQQSKKALIGDKNPVYSLFGKALIKIYPEAKFIWIIRDYRAQVNSMLKVNFEKKVVSSLAARWVSYNKKIEQLKNKYPHQVLLVKYENLVKQPEKQYTQICIFLAIEYNSSVLKTDKHKKEFYEKHHTSLEEKINTHHINEWELSLTENQIKVCEVIAGNYAERFGYKKTTKTNNLTYPKVILGVLYGKCYPCFFKIMYALPLSVRLFINKKIIYKNAPFWKELKKSRLMK